MVSKTSRNLLLNLFVILHKIGEHDYLSWVPLELYSYLFSYQTGQVRLSLEY
jgi:hypothetical protein